MSHEITSTDSAAFALTPAWHGLGTVLDHVPTSGEMREASGLTWEPVPVPILAQTPDVFDGERPDFLDDVSIGPWALDGASAVPDRVALRRSDSGDVLGLVSEGYGIVPNRALFDLLDGLAGETGGAVTYESAFSMAGGRRVAVVARLPGESEIADGDKVRRYVLAQTSHDGSASVDLAPTTVRVVCANTVAAGLAEANRKGERFRIRHTVNALDRLAQARDIIRDAVALWDGDVALARRMAEVRISDDVLTAFLAQTVPVADKAGKVLTNRGERVRADIEERFRKGDLQNLPAISGTLWAAFNAVTEHVDHPELTGWDVTHLRGEEGSRERAESAYLRMAEGSGADLKARAWKTAVQLLDVVSA